MKCHPQIFLFYMNMYGMYFITSTPCFESVPAAPP